MHNEIGVMDTRDLFVLHGIDRIGWNHITNNENNRRVVYTQNCQALMRSACHHFIFPWSALAPEVDSKIGENAHSFHYQLASTWSTFYALGKIQSPYLLIGDRHLRKSPRVVTCSAIVTWIILPSDHCRPRFSPCFGINFFCRPWQGRDDSRAGRSILGRFYSTSSWNPRRIDRFHCAPPHNFVDHAIGTISSWSTGHRPNRQCSTGKRSRLEYLGFKIHNHIRLSD